ncbi:hypothetical protein QBC38DRAFT_143358 [Podospora fimiseda]|uniref:Apple domain-containing protein n=1 Tax=Podospora fimiseda TaxID=252190 RepID=A0AAN7BZ19_9PEZI|nr:hypothetical protein QBC38DRAFT_143358 [Podospora fimiseda]
MSSYQHSDQGSLINSHGIELSNRPRYQEHESQPGLEVCEHSTLEPVGSNKPPLQAGYPLHQYPSYTYPYVQDQKSLWEKVVVSGGAPQPVRPLPSGFEQPHTRPQTGYSSSNNDFTSPFDQRPLVVPPDKGKKRELVCGIKKQLFWIIFAIAVFLLVVAVAAGVGVGVGTRKGSDSPIPTQSAAPTPTRTYPLPTAEAVTSPEGAKCPTNNLTLFTPSRIPERKFLLLCGRDYSSQIGFGTVDLYDQKMDSMGECIDACAAEVQCVGAGWGGQGGKKSCWLKSKLGEANWASHWLFAVEDKESSNLTVSG